MVQIIAHRGASATHPENTITAFRAAVEQGAHGVELDVRRTADDVLVICHDAHLASGAVIRETDFSELPPSVPTLAEALDACADLWLNVEIKNTPSDPDYDRELGLSVAVAGLIAAHDAAERVLVSSFDLASVDRIGAIDPSIPLAWVVWAQADPMSLIERTSAHGLDAIHPHDPLVDADFVRRAHDTGLDVNVWTVDSAERMRQLADMGVDGIVTNRPREAVEALAAHRPAPG